MNIHYASQSQFANWLDAFVTGKSTPGQRSTSHSEATEMQATARQIHDLAGHATRTPVDSSFPNSWEDFMQTRLSNTNISPTLSAKPRMRMPNLPTGRNDSWARVDRLTGILLAAALLIALSAGIWRAADWSSTPPPNPTSELSALIQGTPDGESSPIAMEPVDLPTAEDCTVEPLTVDEVLWYVTGPEAALTNTPEPGQTLEELQALEPKLEEAFANVTTEDMRTSLASQEDTAAAAETQRIWMACIFAESYFQVWALESPYLVQSEVINRLPPLTSVEQTRAILEDLKENGAPVNVDSASGFQQFSEIGYPAPDGIQLISQDIEISWKMDAFRIVLSFNRFEADGTFVDTSNIFNNPTAKEVFSFGGSSLGCDGYRFDWGHAREMWLVAWAPSCG